ncbi:hypothetical protein BO71DRAFT_457457 [Aspergillus ellipticus CBS 707.79]|uniref:Zn(2)-C6 fungal-type domain-containing protein n=1 Tax=Aspergillus ellipticus CBS 707.79 TaxID=1448320 RepID=A0A319DW70_9EURO|nr:hypothetical protein BO71DRAFT_457457 [Aspergillus ellipticus CBS 707.79]
MNTRRRNGKQASCEPCRKDKVRCDHRLPVCTRCQRRSIPGRCFYHPAPLTQRHGHTGRKASASSSSQPPSHIEPANSAAATTPQHATREPSPLQTSFCPPGIDESLPTGYLGPTSFVAALADDRGLVSDPKPESVTENRTLASLPSYWVRKATEVLSCLRDLPTIQKLVREHYILSQSTVTPAPFILSALDEMPTQLRQVSVMAVLQNTSHPLIISPDLEGKRFHGLYTGPRLRLEIIGVLCAIAGQASHFALAHDQFLGEGRAVRREQFQKRMMAASESVIQICRLLTPTNDLTVWVLHQNVLLSGLVHGDSSCGVWHRLGDLSTCIFELGIHRETGNIPIFLRETRRRAFAVAYQLDKSIATFLGRPPRISHRHSDCKLPLDIDEECLAADSAHIQLALRALDEDGWNSRLDGVYQRSSWIRVRFLISTFREEILELSLKDPSPETAHRLRDVSIRCGQVWQSIPAHLHFTPSCWKTQPGLLLRQDPDAEGPLLDVSSTILLTVLTMGRHRELTVDIRRDFLWSKYTRSGQSIPYTGSRAALIRDLSVFTAHLETIAEFDYVHGELLTRASKVFLKIIDEVLDPQVAIAPLPSGIDDLPDISVDGFGISDDTGLLGSTDLGVVVFDQWLF